MRRVLTVLALVVAVLLLQGGEVRAGSAAGTFFHSFTGPAFTATVVVNADAVTPSACDLLAPCPEGTVSIRLQKGGVESSANFVSGAVAHFAFGCDGTNGAVASPTPALTSSDPVQELTNRRFAGNYGWIPDDILLALLAPFGITTITTQAPPVLSDTSDAACTKQPNGVWLLSFSGTMQFGKK